ncbi:MAG TPA: hypothetical protein PLQ04_06085 [Lachnospiraceae bacterium]|nr:hypothetical protein [Lachnospiraceae bacterium]
MINTETQELIVAAKKATKSLLDLLGKLEADHILTDSSKSIAGNIIPELSAYCLAILEVNWEEPTEELICVFADICLTERKIPTEIILSVANNIRRTEKELAKELKNKSECSIIPGGYDMLCQFDAMALEFDGALYSRMKITNPGRMTTYYLDLMGSYLEIITKVCNTAGKRTCPELWEQILSEMKSAMLERQMEILV